MKINESRKSTHSIMNNASFGGVLFKQDNVELYIPTEFIFKNGKLKKYGLKMLAEAKRKANLKRAM